MHTERRGVMSENKKMKRMLIIQAFVPLFLLLMIKYFNFDLLRLAVEFMQNVPKEPYDIFCKTLRHPLFITFILEVICLGWIICGLFGIRNFLESQTANFRSQGETIINKKIILDSGVSFFMTYVLPLVMDDLDTLRGVLSFGMIMCMVFVLVWRTNMYYQNPVLIILGYSIFSFQFETTQLCEFRNKECIGITRGIISEGKSVKRQLISDNVFLIYEDKR